MPSRRAKKEPQIVVTRAEILRVAEVLKMLAARKPHWSTGGTAGIQPGPGNLRVVDVTIDEVNDGCVLYGLPPTAFRGDALEFFNGTRSTARVTFSGNGVVELDKDHLVLRAGETGRVNISTAYMKKPRTSVKVICTRPKSGKKLAIVPCGGPDMGIDDPR